MRIFCCSALLILLTCLCAIAGEFEELPVQNAGINRVLSGTSDLLKTTKLEAHGLQILDQPSVELMIDVEVKGETQTLVPSDFGIKAIDSSTRNAEKRTSIELRSKIPELPLVVYMDYWYDPAHQYQEKSVTISPCARAAGAILKRVTIDSMQLTKTMTPLAVNATGFVNENRASFAAIDQKTGRGVCFSFPGGKVEYNRFRSLTAYQKTNVPLEKGFETGRFAVGDVSGAPDVVFAAYRQMLLDTRYPSLSSNQKFIALRKRFAQCFGTCQYLPALSTDGSIDAEGHVADGKGFILLFNSSAEVKTAALPLANAGLGLSGDLSLSDWTSLTTPAAIASKKPEDKVEIEVPAHGYKIVGVNIND